MNKDILLFECVMGVIVISKDVDAVRGIANRVQWLNK